MSITEAKIIHFSGVPEYVNEGGRNQLCRDLLQEGEIGHIGVGHNVMKAEAFEGCEYGAGFSKDDIPVLFPFFT